MRAFLLRVSVSPRLRVCFYLASWSVNAGAAAHAVNLDCGDVGAAHDSAVGLLEADFEILSDRILVVCGLNARHSARVEIDDGVELILAGTICFARGQANGVTEAVPLPVII